MNIKEWNALKLVSFKQMCYLICHNKLTCVNYNRLPSGGCYPQDRTIGNKTLTKV